MLRDLSPYFFPLLFLLSLTLISNTHANSSEDFTQIFNLIKAGPQCEKPLATKPRSFVTKKEAMEILNGFRSDPSFAWAYPEDGCAARAQLEISNFKGPPSQA